MMTKLRNHTSRVHPVTSGFCLLRLAYLCSRQTAKSRARVNSMRRITGAVYRDFPSISATGTVPVQLTDFQIYFNEMHTSKLQNFLVQFSNSTKYNLWWQLNQTPSQKMDRIRRSKTLKRLKKIFNLSRRNVRRRSLAEKCDIVEVRRSMVVHSQLAIKYHRLLNCQLIMCQLHQAKLIPCFSA